MTRARRALHLYVPVRYYHGPDGRRDAYGYGKPSRFLTDELQALCPVTRPGEPPSHLSASGGAHRRIAVSVDALFD
jgi:DNA helicase-2/ATP-dependent DNA helicase PcrA